MEINELINRLIEARDKLGGQPVDVEIIPAPFAQEAEQQIISVKVWNGSTNYRPRITICSK
jgi:hypothetical protein